MPLLDVVEDALGQGVVVVLLEQFEAESVDRSDVEICEPFARTSSFLPAVRNAVDEFRGGTFVERERDDVFWAYAGELELADHASRHALGLAGTGASDELDVAVER